MKGGIASFGLGELKKNVCGIQSQWHHCGQDVSGKLDCEVGSSVHMFFRTTVILISVLEIEY